MDAMFSLNKYGQKEFDGGQEDWEIINLIAKKCDSFLLDDEDEIVSDELISCYNCRYRRWTARSFSCYKMK